MSTFGAVQKLAVVKKLSRIILLSEEDAFYEQLCRIVWDNNNIQDMRHAYIIFRGKLHYLRGFDKPTPGVKQPLLHLSLHDAMSKYLRDYREFELNEKNAIHNYLTEVVNFTDNPYCVMALIPEGYHSSLNHVQHLFPENPIKTPTDAECQSFMASHATTITQIKLRQMNQLLQIA